MRLATLLTPQTWPPAESARFRCDHPPRPSARPCWAMLINGPYRKRGISRLGTSPYGILSNISVGYMGLEYSRGLWDKQQVLSLRLLWEYIYMGTSWDIDNPSTLGVWDEIKISEALMIWSLPWIEFPPLGYSIGEIPFWQQMTSLLSKNRPNFQSTRV